MEDRPWGSQTPQSSLPELETEILKAMKERLKVTPKILWAGPCAFERSPHKTRFIELRKA